MNVMSNIIDVERASEEGSSAPDRRSCGAPTFREMNLKMQAETTCTCNSSVCEVTA
jgi:hypothetical protein